MPSRIKMFFVFQFYAFLALFNPRLAVVSLFEVVVTAARQVQHERTAEAMGIKK